jgi:hypothetical protein
MPDTQIRYTHIVIHISNMMNRLLSAIPSSSRSTSTIRPIVSTGRTQYVKSMVRSSRLYSTRPAPTGLDEGEKAIYEKLAAKFPGDRLEVQDVSGNLHILRPLRVKLMIRRMWFILRYRD